MGDRNMTEIVLYWWMGTKSFQDFLNVSKNY